MPRHDRRGGGVGLIYRDSYKAKRVKFEKFSSFEHQTVSLSCGTQQLVITCVYLSSGVFTQDFSSQFSELLSFLQAENAKHLIVGDFNFHVNIDTDVDAKKLISLLHQFDLIQHVNVPTHTAGNTLDLVISKDDLLVRDISTDLSERSDHFAVLFTLSFPSPGLPKQTVTYRSWKSVDHDKLRNDIGEAFSDFTCSDVESAVHNYNEVLQHIVDKHAPEKTRVVTIRPDAPWYNSKLSEEKRLKRKYERKYNRSQLAIDRELYCHQRDRYNNLLNTTKQDYFKNKVESATSTKELFKVCNNLLNRTNENVLPSHNCGTELANRFVNYFGDKIKSIRQDLENSSNTPDYTTNVASDFDGVPLEKFRIVHQDEVRKIITSSPSKSCALDPIPTSILKLCLDELTPVLTLIVNTSLKFADFSPKLKRAFILPLLKKVILDCEILKNFRPVSNLSLLSKLVERIVCVQLVDHLKAHNLYEVFQSAYRQLHSTETALLRIQNDLLRAVDTHGGAILVLLDLSAAFDTIDHHRLLHTLESSFGIQGKALDWFHSYLTGRTQTVHIKKSTSEPHELQYGVPQGSVLGPILFTIYTTPLGELIRRHGLTFHLYADDTQLYLTFKPSEPSSINNIISQLENCIEDIRAWMKLNLLKLNDDKTEMLVITSRPSTSQSLNISVKVGDQYINPSDEPPKNLGVIFDSTCSLKYHVANVCRSINFNLYSIGKIRKYLDRPTVEKLVNATITSRLDYCNSLMFGIPKDLMSQLQKRQNHAARVITQWRKYDHITPVLVDLHWLPVKQRIDFKILLLTYKALNGLAPAYIRELLTPYIPARTLRSMDNNLLEPPKCRLEYFGKRSFAAAAPVLWNDLPLHIKQSPSVDIFKSRIKTRLFQLAYFI